MAKQYYVKNVETGEEHAIVFNAIVNNIRMWLQVNLLGFGFYYAIKDGREHYTVYNRFNKQPQYVIDKK